MKEYYNEIRIKFLRASIFIERFSSSIEFNFYFYKYAIEIEFRFFWIDLFLCVGDIK